MSHKWLKHSDKDSVKDLMTKLSKKDLKNLELMHETSDFARKEIDKRKIIIKKPLKNLEINTDNSRIPTEQSDTTLEEDKLNNTAKFEEPKTRHKKTPAISLKNNFIDSIKGFTQSNKNENYKKIKYPKHEGNINPSSTKHKNFDHLPIQSQPEQPQMPVSSKDPTQADQRREMPRQGYTSSGTDSRGSGGIKNPLKIQQEIAQDVRITASYQQYSKRHDDRNALSQDCAVELNQMRPLESNDNQELTHSNNYHKNQRVTNISDFLNLDHNNPQYSSSTRGYVGQDKSNYSLSPNHTKLPSSNFGYFVDKNSSRNAKLPCRLEQIRTDPAVFHSESHNSRNKYSSGMAEGYKDQRKTYETEEKQHMIHSSDVDEMRMMSQQINYDSLKRNSQDQQSHHQIKTNYNKYVEKNYRSGGSGSTSGGTSVDGVNYFKNQFYPRVKLNISELTDQMSIQHPNEKPENIFYQVKTNNIGYNLEKKRMMNRNSRDNMYLSSGRRQVVSRNISNKGSGNYSNSYQVENNKNKSNTSMFTSNDNSAESREIARLHFEEQRMSTQGFDDNGGYLRNSDYYRSENSDIDYQNHINDFVESIDWLSQLSINLQNCTV